MDSEDYSEQPADSAQHPKIVLVGHRMNQDLAILEMMGINIDMNPSTVSILDTPDLAFDILGH